MSPFPEKEDYDIAYQHLKQENDRLQHLTTVLIDHIWKTGERGLPLQDIDRQMKLFDVRVGGEMFKPFKGGL